MRIAQLRGGVHRPARRRARSSARSSTRSWRAGRHRRRWRCSCTTPSRRTRWSQTVLEMVRGGIRDLPVDAHRVPRRRRLDAAAGFVVVCRSRCAASTATKSSAIARCGRFCQEERSTTSSCSSRPACTRRGHRDARVAPEPGPARRGMGQPPAVGPRHPRVVSAAVPPPHRAWRDQLRRQPCAQPAVSGALRPLRVRHAVGCAGGARPRTRVASPFH